MKYISLNDLSNTIRNNIWKIPRDIDFIIGVPRSGMIAASIISSYLNVPLIDVNSYIAGIKPYGGYRLSFFLNGHKTTNKALVIDDTVSNGRAMGITKEKLSQIKGIDFTYMCVYLEGRAENAIDFYLEDVRQYTENFTGVVLYEWNLFQHQPQVMIKCLYDIDGALCVDPPDERNEDEYINYIKNPKPLFIPRTKMGGIVTYRLSKYREITEKWLNEQGIKYNELIMFNGNTYEERAFSGVSPEKLKGEYYRTHDNYNLFIESDERQAKKIVEISNKPVYCVETNQMYQ